MLLRSKHLDRKTLVIAEAGAIALQDEEELMRNRVLMRRGPVIRREDLHAESEGHTSMGQRVEY